MKRYNVGLLGLFEKSESGGWCKSSDVSALEQAAAQMAEALESLNNFAGENGLKALAAYREVGK